MTFGTLVYLETISIVLMHTIISLTLAPNFISRLIGIYKGAWQCRKIQEYKAFFATDPRVTKCIYLPTLLQI